MQAQDVLPPQSLGIYKKKKKLKILLLLVHEMKCAEEASLNFLSCWRDVSEERVQMYYAKNQLSQNQTENSHRVFMRTRTLLALKKKIKIKLLITNYVYLTGAIRVDFCSWENLVDMHSTQPFVV